MKTISYYYLENEQQWLGYLQAHPDYWEEAESFDNVQSNLSSLSKYKLATCKSMQGSRIPRLS